MYCPNCGKMNPEGAAFCSSCGTRLPAEQAGKSPEIDRENGTARSKLHQENRYWQKVKKWILLAAVLVIGFGAFKIFYRPTVDLNQCLTVSFDGRDGYARVNVAVDEDEFQDRYAGKLKLNQRALKKYMEEPEDSVYRQFAESVDYYKNNLTKRSVTNVFRTYFLGSTGSIYPSDHLSNGDELTYSWYLHDGLVKVAEDIFRCRIKYDDYSVKVKGLEEVGSYDPFAGLSIDYEGVDHHGTAVFTNTDSTEQAGDIRYSIKGQSEDDTQSLSNGDQITVVAESVNGDTWDAEYYGEVLSPTEKTYTVSGIPVYVESSDELSDEERNALNNEMQSQIEDFAKQNCLNDDESILDMKCAGYLFYCIKDVNDADLSGDGDPDGTPFNIYVVVYRIRIKSGQSSRAIYARVWFHNIKKNDEGEIKHEKEGVGNERLFLATDDLFLTTDDLRKDLTNIDWLEELYTCEDHLNIF